MGLYTLFVILFGAVVRITGSGAGCGQHWPTCHGEVAHLPQSVETLIEMTHRLTSGLCMVFVVGLAVWTFRAFAAGHMARRAAVLSCVFMLVEALVGAALVLLELVGLNDSWRRAAVMALHLINTCALMFWIVVAWWTSRPERGARLRLGVASRVLPWGAVVIVGVSAAGAVTALGDTLYPVEAGESLGRVVEQASSGGAHFLEQLRGFHPLLAVLGAAFLLQQALSLNAARGLRLTIFGTVVLQIALGFFNIYLMAPGWMQVLHLAVANLLWIFWTLAWLQACSPSRVSSSSPSAKEFS